MPKSSTQSNLKSNRPGGTMNQQSPQARWLAAAALALFAAACAQSNGDVNRVQPNVTRKSDLLDGEWYFRNSVTYTPHNTQFTYPGQTGNMEKLVWEIQENNLVGYRSYPYILGAEANVDKTSIISGTTAKYCDRDGKCTGGQKYYGSPVVAFPILSHFDVQRGYNPQTGEQTNVISENTTDRYWNQREFIRVNWAANVLNTMQGMSWGTVQNPGSSTTSSNWVQPNEKDVDPTDLPTFEYEGEGDARKLKYFDVTARYLAVPDTTYFEGWGAVPLCWFASGIYDCTSSEIKMRVSVSKVDTKRVRDFEPLLYPNDMMSLFGVFRTERLNWDRKFGAIESARILIGQRHRLWEEYYQKDGTGQPDVTKPIEPAQRKVKPIVYYFSRADRMGGEDRYNEFFEPGQIIARDYDRAFKRAVAAVRGVKPEDVKEQVYFLCDNPVKKGNPKECGAEGFSPKFGDLRYSFMNTVAEPVANGLLGYGPSSADPETGEVISGNSNSYLWGVDLYGRSVTDWILLQSGEKNLTEYISGRDVANFIKQNPVYNVANINKQNATIQAELQGIPQRNVETQGAFAKPSPRLSRVLGNLKGAGGLPKATRNEMRVAAETLAQNPQLESAVIDNPEIGEDIVNLLPPFAQERAKTDREFRREMSRLALTNYQSVHAWQTRRLEFLSKNNIYMAEFFDRSLVGVANELLAKRDQNRDGYKANGNAKCATPTACTDTEATNLANDDIARHVRQQVWLSTSLHEMGHTLNLRHNFQGSFDAINYFDNYWPLRKATITVQQNNQPVIPRTPNDLKAAAEGTEGQRLSSMHNYEYSSIMDYAGKIFTDWNGLGKYDEAAIIFAYTAVSKPGGTGAATTDTSYVEVFNGARRDTMQFRGSDGNQMSISGAQVDLPLVNVTHTNPNVRNYTERFHYSLAPLHFGEGPATNISAVIDDGIEKLKSRRLVKYEDVRRDEERVREILNGDPSLANDPDRANGVIGTSLLRVPYMFCSDESADGPVQSCYRFDRGADYYEQTRNHLEDYWNYYVDTHFRRDRAFFSGNGAVNSAFGTFYNVANSYKHYMFELYRQPSSTQEQRLNYRVDPVLQDLWTIAVIDGINQHLNVMSVPPFGLFMYRTLRTTGPRWDVISEGDDFDALSAEGRTKYQELYSSRLGATDFAVMPRGLGRRMYSRYDFKSGYNFFRRMNEAGHYNDQLGAMFAAVLPQIDVQGVDTDSDQNRFNVPYYLLFKDEMTDTFGALWGNDELKVRPTAFKRTNDRGDVTDNLGLFWRVYVNGSDIFANFNYPPQQPGRCTGNARPPTCFTSGQNPAPANIQMTWTSRIYALWLGMALFRVNYDLDYAKTNQIYRLGGNEDFTVAPGYEKVEVPDVTTGARYVALRPTCAPNTVCPDTAATSLVRHTQDVLLMVQEPGRCPIPDYLVVQGYGCLAAEQANNPRIVEDRRRFWTEVFRDAVRDLDLARSMYGAFGRAF
ncbi:MAG: hypothetical protein IAE78_14920 [Myxococcus sp.]|nr:hypothetical protein [Myxococcus sp.]